jgi:protoporphyrinogen oxidase
MMQTQNRNSEPMTAISPIETPTALPQRTTVAVIGAGPAGLTAAYMLCKRGIDVTVIEADPQYVGGISRTVKNNGFHFDIGGHRFFSKSQQVEDFWNEILPNDMLERPRSSRIYYRNRFFQYPLKPFEALFQLGILESVLCVLSFLKARVRPHKNPVSFQDWVSNQFGSRLFNIFFKTYTEKVWGMSCRDISADWAAQRIKGLSLYSAVKAALLPKPKAKKHVIKTLIDTFRYPRKGPGMMWETCAERVRALGGKIHMGHRVSSLQWDESTQTWLIGTDAHDPQAQALRVQSQHLISSAPMRDLVRSIKPELPTRTRYSAESLRYRDFLTVTLVLRSKELFSDNWIYIHDPSVKVGRIQNFKSWSPEMVPDPSYGCYGLEYFCFEGDGTWTMSDEELIALARRELMQIKLGEGAEFVEGHVVRQAKAYPVYDENYQKHVDTIRTDLETHAPTLHPVGRNGMHKYNNQDHAIMTAMLSVENILAGKRVYDVWQVNQDAEYHEAGERPSNASGASGASGLRAVPTRITDQPANNEQTAA